MKIDFSTFITGIFISLIVGIVVGIVFNSEAMMAGVTVATAIIYAVSLNKE